MRYLLLTQDDERPRRKQQQLCQICVLNLAHKTRSANKFIYVDLFVTQELRSDERGPRVVELRGRTF